MKNVRDFGAHGNGVDDDTDAFRNALDACAPGETCFVRRYLPDSPRRNQWTYLPSYLELSCKGIPVGAVLKLMDMPTDSMILAAACWVVSDRDSTWAISVPSGQPGKVALDCRGNRWQV
jgi:hypothetical protein